MKREQFSTTDSVAHFFKVTTARTRRRLLRREDPVDWELLSQILGALYEPRPDPWPVEPMDALVMVVMAGLRPGRDAMEVQQKLLVQAGGSWVTLMDPDVTCDQLGISETELGHLRTVLRSLIRRFGGLTLDPIHGLKDNRALLDLLALPGVDPALICTLLLRSFGRPILPPTPEVRRVLTRMGVLPAGLADTDTIQHLRRIPAGVPLDTLMCGLATLSNQVCHQVKPDCPNCPLVKLCDQGRLTLKRGCDPSAMSMVDLFAGAGGMSLGLTDAGFVPVLAVELEEWACETYRANHPELPRDRVLAGDIRKIDPASGLALLKGKRPDLVVGGPPCQGFSLIGKRGRSKTRFIDDPRNKLYGEYVRWVAQLRPRFVVIENVPGLYSYANGAIRRDIEASLMEIGYAVDDLVLDAGRLGVPQKRQRVVFVGASVENYGGEATTLVRRVVALLEALSRPEVTLHEAIADLPALEAGTGSEASLTRSLSSPSAYAQEMGAQKGRVLYHHVARPINLRDKLLYARLKPGETAGDAIDQGARHLMVYRNDVFEDKYRRLRYEEPAPTIMSHLAKDGHMFIHPDPKQRRSLTVREAARIQSFPDDFLFLGPRTAQFTQVGNAVPPRLARAIGEAIKQALSEVIG